MSLINDALKKAKDTQPAGAPIADGPALRPVDLEVERPNRPNPLVPALVVFVLLLSGLFLWQWFHASDQFKVRARVVSVADVAPRVSTPTETPRPAVAQTPAPAPVITPVPTVAAIAPTPAPAQPAEAATAPMTADAAPAVYKLQGIFFRQKDSTAMINGRLVSVGERIGDARVTAISHDSATLHTFTGQTLKLELP